MPKKPKLEAIVVKKLRRRTKQTSVFRVQMDMDGTRMVCTTCGHIIEGMKIAGRDPKAADKAALEMIAQVKARPTVARECPVCTKRLRDTRFPRKPPDAR
jgi:hypothetical protein